MVLDADAVVYPGAVVVEPLHAPVADVAVARVCCADDLTGWTEDVGVKLLDKLYERDLRAALHVAWFRSHGQVEEELGGEKQCSEEWEPNVTVDVRKHENNEAQVCCPQQE